MSLLNDSLLNDLVASTTDNGKKSLTLTHLEAYVSSVPKEHENYAKLHSLLAYAYLAVLNDDLRHLTKVIHHASIANDLDLLENATHLALRYKRARDLKNMGMPSLIQYGITNFRSWYWNEGWKWCDILYDSTEGVVAIDPEDHKLYNEYFISRDLNTHHREDNILADTRLGVIRRKLLLRLIDGEVPVIEYRESHRNHVPDLFERYASDQGIQILSQLQCGHEGSKRCSYVYSARDSDGIVKIYKEILDNSTGRMEQWNDEYEVYEHIKDLAFVPKCYERVHISDGVYFIRQEYLYGPSLADYIHMPERIPVEQTKTIIAQIAVMLDSLHKRDVWYLDLKPEHILFTQEGLKIIDFGVSRCVKPDEKWIDIHLATPRYVTPEGARECRAYASSDIFQLGIIAYELLTGTHPFAISTEEMIGISREEELLRYAWPTIINERKVLSRTHNELSRLILAMLSTRDIRPSLEVIRETLTGDNVYGIPSRAGREKSTRKREKNTILFPARMGIPHKGHIDYICRLLELGYHVTISLQRSYTITDRDPIPKWLVMKMITLSLLEYGFGNESFHFIFTPFYETDQEMHMHFAMLPERQNIIGVASSNPSVKKLFGGFPLFEQSTVFGIEKEEYRDRSWGEILRKSVKDNDYDTFKEYAAYGVEEVVSFEDLQTIYAKTTIDFVPGVVRVVLKKGVEIICKGKVLRYGSPEESIVYHCNRSGVAATLGDTDKKQSTLSIENDTYPLIYEYMTFDGTNETIYYRI